MSLGEICRHSNALRRLTKMREEERRTKEIIDKVKKFPQSFAETHGVKAMLNKNNL